MKIYHRVDGSIVLWRNPRTEAWEEVTDFGSNELAIEAANFYNSKDYDGWISKKLSKSTT